MNQINSVCVYSASSSKIDKVYFEAAGRLGKLLAERRIRLVNGAGSIGLMRSVADAVLENGGEVTGVIPRFMVEQGWHHTGLTRLVEVESMHERKQLMADLSDAVIALPGGIQTAFSIRCSTSLSGLLTRILCGDSMAISGMWLPLLKRLSNWCIGFPFGMRPSVNLRLYECVVDACIGF